MDTRLSVQQATAILKGHQAGKDSCPNKIASDKQRGDVVTIICDRLGCGQLRAALNPLSRRSGR